MADDTVRCGDGPGARRGPFRVLDLSLRRAALDADHRALLVLLPRAAGRLQRDAREVERAGRSRVVERAADPSVDDLAAECGDDGQPAAHARARATVAATRPDWHGE